MPQPETNFGQAAIHQCHVRGMDDDIEHPMREDSNSYDQGVPPAPIPQAVQVPTEGEGGGRVRDELS